MIYGFRSLSLLNLGFRPPLLLTIHAGRGVSGRAVPALTHLPPRIFRKLLHLFSTMTWGSLKSALRPVQQVRSASIWARVPEGPPDAILGITEAFKRDPSPKKINLGVGAYRNDKGEPYVLPSVRAAEQSMVADQLDKEYAPITGVPSFVDAAVKLAYGNESPAVLERRIAATQTISGTGALRVGAEFLSKFSPSKKILIPTPTWANHRAVLTAAGLEPVPYRYYDAETISLNINGLLEDLQKAEPGTPVLLHACAHNPTGVDPTRDQWHQIFDVVKSRGLFPFFDMAYQGFASGDVNNDAYAVRYFVENGLEVALCQSFAKNMGLYGERVGAFSLVAESSDRIAPLTSQLKILIRPLYSNPPINGACIASKILNDQGLKMQWLEEVRAMADRMIAMRSLLKSNLKSLGSTKNWDHITSQIGMFCYTGLTPEQVEALAKNYSVYGTKDGRISICGVNSSNVEYLSEAIYNVAG